MYNRRKYILKFGTIASIILYVFSGFLLVGLPLVLGESGKSDLALVTRLAAAVTIALGGLGVQLLTYKEAIEARIEEHSKGLSVRLVGDSDSAVAEVLRKVRNARNVHNTFIGIRQSSSRKAADLYQAWITNPNAEEWVDIVGPAQIFDDRYKLVKVNADRIVGSHSVYVIRHSTPIVNFIILDYPFFGDLKSEEDSEVYFGWISSEKDSQRIFHSNDRVVVNTFRNYFRALKSHRTWGDPVLVDYRAENISDRILRSDLVDKIGTWYTISIDDSSVRTFGFFTIDITRQQTEAKKAGVIEISGVLLNADLSFREAIKHREQNVSHYQNKIFIEYGDRPEADRKGFCFYEFRREQVVGVPDSIDAVSGFFVDEGAWKRNLIIGRKDHSRGMPNDHYAQRLAALEALNFALASGKITAAMHENALSQLS